MGEGLAFSLVADSLPYGVSGPPGGTKRSSGCLQPYTGWRQCLVEKPCGDGEERVGALPSAIRRPSSPSSPIPPLPLCPRSLDPLRNARRPRWIPPTTRRGDGPPTVPGPEGAENPDAATPLADFHSAPYAARGTHYFELYISLHQPGTSLYRIFS